MDTIYAIGKHTSGLPVFYEGPGPIPNQYGFAEVDAGAYGQAKTAAEQAARDAVAAVVPGSCSKLGLKRALAETGAQAIFPKPEWPAVKDLLSKDPDLQEDWDLAVEIRRTDPLVQGVIAARKYDDATVDKILLRANELAA